MAKVVKILSESSSGEFIEGKWHPKVYFTEGYVNPDTVSRVLPIKTKDGANKTLLYMKRGPYMIVPMQIEEVVGRLFPYGYPNEPEVYYSEPRGSNG